MKALGITLVTVLLAVVREGTAASPCAPITDHFYTKTANESVELICEVTQQPADIIKWIDPNGKVVSSNCVASNSRYSVTCEPANAPTKYKLAFTARWSDRGTYTCKCESSGFSMSTRLTVKVPPPTLSASCTVKATGEVCIDTSRKGSDVLQFKAAVGCSYPSATITWTDELGIPISTSKYGGVFKNESCTGALAGQRSGTNTFEGTWADLGKPSKVNVAAANEVGGLYFDLPIHKPPEKEDTAGVVIGAILGVLLFLIIIGLIIFLVVRAKKKKQRMAYV
ncbi:uncharacterized protein LOC135502354 [Lineus longissimus]|uniref:uncharacterized protein LOC135502354 n=1 Tax=Lineus longissimus TaxID=88925 RepID=UPI002B4C930C